MLRRTIPENGRARRCRAESDLLFIRFIKFETSSFSLFQTSPFTKFSAINLFLSYFSGIRTHPSFLGKRSKRELIPLREPLLLPEPRFSISRIRFHGGATGLFGRITRNDYSTGRMDTPHGACTRRKERCRPQRSDNLAVRAARCK